MYNFKQATLLYATKYALAFLWIFTGLTSVYFAPDVGYEILAGANIVGLPAKAAIYAGGMLDIALGLWLVTSFKTQVCCLVQVAVIITYTALLTLIDASFWLHPFGPITKNIPIVVLICFLFSENKSQITIK
ncbi:NAD-dependent dehydratase [Pseudoalteromonas porphyrae]|uniref:NAD-dependent dehydratase n=1 Tax=Pseudoalteromonas porphyrae TaxID=187330 RepID=A0A0N0M0S5_9GAMM|nr:MULTISPECIES: DoxX-like family protein [Pseudoalteromonas]KPH63799.1 NAD-dependent dehydratase [Pseudoalteromonas porphyrae]KPH96453.1 NAD-dependent dehydratase [Pseudoalteromonas porphyrae]NMR25774.1 NAD-dependent dehydratase [Pseudoalteromonas sp. NEC-BIFX-2020_015]NNG41850.1 NAD-dependent dehydratase [Pseudoalteromonas sp. NEC-BIFX-2020_002]